MKKSIFLGAITMIAILLLAHVVFASHGENDNQCNSNNPENCPVPTEICDNGEHVGNPHCNPTPTPTVEVTVTPTLTPTPTQGCGEDCDEVTPTPTEEVTPTVTPTQDSGDNHGDGLSDGRSSCPSCTEAPQGQVYSSYDGSPVGMK